LGWACGRPHQPIHSLKHIEQIKLTFGEATVHEAFTNKVQFGKSLAQRKSVFHFKSSDYRELQEQFMVMTQTVEKELHS